MDFLIPVSAYLHIPFCRRRCYYCDFPISVLGDKTNTNTSGSISEYVQFLCEEIKITPTYNRPLKTVFFGGGTPSLLPPRYLDKILATLDQQFGICADAEISMEMDPGTFSLQQLSDYKTLGVNRFSLGIQSFDDKLLEKSGRFHRYKDIEQSIDFIYRTNIINFSLDLISGLPYQTLEDWKSSLEKAIKIQPSHISCYDLVLEPVTAFGKQYKPGKFPLPDDDNTMLMYKMGQRILTEAGYEHYEISNYAQQGYQCLHNLVYWENKPYYGLGMGAASYSNNQRFTRPRTRKDYYQWIEKLKQSDYSLDCDYLDTIDIILETFMLGLRLKKGVDWSKIYTSFGENFIELIYKILLPYYQQKLVYFQDINDKFITEIKDNNLHDINRVMLSDPDGFLLSNTILADLFAQLESTI
ncbi:MULTISPECIES: radical SAM family heme chaperone HemW [Crocosphaera]|uniref:Heme chaperone HemW n=3 Tax=Crocosphaera watsonii TaxID=263511 RepID=T2JXI6_CROWT|nr:MULTISPECIES: radical SAM family heme chaperone HemW [Crocosphaera]EHJ14081.1 Putative coproporphyrinogen III oxidase of BS HemN-type [Crocosphaera watsonii WH 0003]MCH2246871.1 radical SAM family heme chaperone HemW [Crocosphaera sp.]CCQ55714.1 Putative coproporphyrinogen III oxidase of BS HemN-type, oxygen-independent, in heat shock gene cluster [Crocosphaera watsonii WH 0005]CCQ70513.1 Putative coproporphyrinogen III oxidase of BS HemN-type, oxygen-independent, in heat shock gene cluster 